MVNYNPHAPTVLGQEWVPIRNEYTIFGENQASGSEVGTTFTLTSSTQVNNARFYLDDFVYGRFVNEGVTFNIYPAGQEDQSGPIQKVVIPCTSGATTGGITFSTPATDVPSALRNPGTIRQSGLIFNGVAGFTAFRAQFGVMQNTYAQALAGKRILGVTLVSQIIIDNSLTVDSDEPIESIIDINIEYGLRRISSSAAFLDWELQPVMEMESGDNMTTPPRNTDVTRRDRLGNFSMYGATMLTNGDTYPWTYEELTKFDSNFGASSVAVQVMANNLNSNIPLVRFTYMALEVYFCEEKRVAFGTQVFNEGPVTLGTETRYQRGMNRVELYNLAGSTNPILPAGDYIVTVSQTDFGDNFDITDKTNTSLRLNSLRELYALPSFETKEIILPSIMDDTALGQALSDDEIVIVPQLSLHLSGGAPLTQVHPYGRQGVAQVWGNIVAVQEVNDSLVGGDREYPWVKFIARRWGDTTVPLTIAGLDTLTGSTASITPDEFDALPEILDGWKEVNLQFDNAATMGSIGDPTFEWSASGETNGNRWEILAAVAPALSGTQGNLFNGVPTTQQLYTATYYAPTGDVQELVWMPQGVASQWISGAGVADDAADAFLILGEEVIAPSGIGIVTLCQPVSGIGRDCELDPCCIPSSIAFNQLTWTPGEDAEDPALNYGYEIQRMDTVETDWQTIMLSSSPLVDTFNDFEARIGVETCYRIRTINDYGFYSDWVEFDCTVIEEPGIVIGCEGGHILTFTSNERQDGSINLAYSSVWFEQRVEETFTFPEAGFVTLQPMYDRDYFVAFRPTERGGESFNRTVLVQAAAIDPETLGDFRSLRDMAWENVNYICVRDEDGNRWFASIGVPSGRVLNNRRLYLAPVQIVEVTDTPTPVDPEVDGHLVGEECA